MRASIRFGRSPLPSTLAEAVDAVSKRPSKRNRRAFLDLAASAEELLFLVSEIDRPVVNGEIRSVAADDRVALATVETDGRSYLLAFPDQETAIRHDPAAAYAGMPAARAAAMALADASMAGILVTLADEGRSWAALARPALEALVAAHEEPAH